MLTTCGRTAYRGRARIRSADLGASSRFPASRSRRAEPTLQCCGRRVSRIRHLRGGRTIATITVAAPTMYPLEALPGDVYVRDGEKVAEVAREVPVWGSRTRPLVLTSAFMRPARTR